MIPRYSLPEMSAVWSEPRKLSAWKEVEALVLEAWAAAGVGPESAAEAVRAAADVDIGAWKAREETTGHDVAAFVDELADSMAGDAEWLHYGLTSSDVLDTAQGAILKEAGTLLLERTNDLLGVVKKKALDHRSTVMVGRTHGVHALPITFGFKVATWADELSRHLDRLISQPAEASQAQEPGAAPDIALQSQSETEPVSDTPTGPGETK